MVALYKPTRLSRIVTLSTVEELEIRQNVGKEAKPLDKLLSLNLIKYLSNLALQPKQSIFTAVAN